MKRKLGFSILLIFFLGGCAYNASLVNTTNDMLAMSKQSYDTTGKVVADLYRQGRISEEKRSDIINIARPYAIAHNELTETLAVYEETKDASHIEKIEAMVTKVSEALGEFLTEVEKYIVKED